MSGYPPVERPEGDIRTRVLLQHQRVADDALVVQRSVSELHSLVMDLVEENTILKARLGEERSDRPMVMAMRTVRDAYCGGASSGFWKDLQDATDVVLAKLEVDELPTKGELVAMEPWTGAIMACSRVMPNVLIWAFLEGLAQLRAAVSEEAVDEAARFAR